jgi:hypothetical protein
VGYTAENLEQVLELPAVFHFHVFIWVLVSYYIGNNILGLFMRMTGSYLTVVVPGPLGM